MEDIYDIISNIENLYDSNTSFQVLKDFERVLDELDLYVYKNWQQGELAKGPHIERHWVTCSFMWPKKEMPDPSGGKRLLDYDCKVKYKKTYLLQPRKIRKPSDIRPGSKKGKMDRVPIWIVEIQMPKQLIADIYAGYAEKVLDQQDDEISIPSQSQEADDLAVGSDMETDTGMEEGNL